MFILQKLSYHHRKNLSRKSISLFFIFILYSGWHRITLPLPMATLQQEYIRFRISTPPSAISTYSTSNYSWAIDKGK
jgi:hypothetical protein